MRRKNALFWFLFFGLFFAGGSLLGEEHSLILSTSGPASTTSLPEIQDEELLLYTPGDFLGPEMFFSRLNWKSVVGDGNGNGMYDEVPSDVDGIHLVNRQGNPPILFDFAFSLDTSLTFASGDTVDDGDIFMVLPGGGVWKIISEEEICDATCTSGIDVDGFTFSPSGDLIFSLDQDEETSHEGLIAENNGDATIREGTILWLEGPSRTPHILYTEEAVLEMVNHAVGGSLCSIVDTQGIENDPVNPGELLFLIASSTSSVEGTVFSTLNGGSVAEVNGHLLTGGSFGFSTEEVLSALAVVPAMKKPLRIEANEEVSLAGLDFLQVKVFNGTPGKRVQLVGSFVLFPITPPTFLSPPLSGTKYVFADYSSPQFWLTATNRFYSLRLDGEGKGTFYFPAAYLMPDRFYIAQALDYNTHEASYGAVVATVQ